MISKKKKINPGFSQFFYKRLRISYSLTRKKGQYRIVFETMLILVGIFITGYVVSNFGDVEDAATAFTLQDNFNAVANDVVIGLVKVSQRDSGIIRVDVPDNIAGHVYKVALGGNSISVTSLEDKSIFVERQIFNIGQENNGNIIIASEVVSSARTVEIIAQEEQLGRTIRIRRGT